MKIRRKPRADNTDAEGTHGRVLAAGTETVRGRVAPVARTPARRKWDPRLPSHSEGVRVGAVGDEAALACARPVTGPARLAHAPSGTGPNAERGERRWRACSRGIRRAAG